MNAPWVGTGNHVALCSANAQHAGKDKCVGHYQHFCIGTGKGGFNDRDNAGSALVVY